MIAMWPAPGITTSLARGNACEIAKDRDGGVM